MPVCSLERDEAGMDVGQLEAVLQPTIRFPGCYGQEPAVLLKRVQELEHAIEQRLLNLSCRPKGLERLFVVLGEPPMLLRTCLGQQSGHRFSEVEADYASRYLRR